MKIVPAILTDDPQELKTLISAAEEYFDQVQIDILDGKFADNETVDPSAMNYIETNMNLGFQLMVQNPINWVEKCVRAGSWRIIGHVEEMEDQFEFVKKVSQAGVKVGLGLDLETEIHKLQRKLLGDIDAVLVMSVAAGFGGQTFNEFVLEKVEELAKIKKEEAFDFQIVVDGGIAPAHMEDLAAAGVDEVVIGRRLFSGDVAENIAKFAESLED